MDVNCASVLEVNRTHTNIAYLKVVWIQSSIEDIIQKLLFWMMIPTICLSDRTQFIEIRKLVFGWPQIGSNKWVNEIILFEHLANNFVQKCTSQCGEGVQYRSIFCDRSPPNTDRCDIRFTPDTTRQCTVMDKCDIGEWFVGSWNQCSGDCFNLTQTRTVYCIKNGFDGSFFLMKPSYFDDMCRSMISETSLAISTVWLI